MYFFLNGGHSGTPHAVPELSSKHHLRGLSRRSGMFGRRDRFEGRRRHYSASVPPQKAGLLSPYLPKPCSLCGTCERPSMISSKNVARWSMSMAKPHANFMKALHAESCRIEPLTSYPESWPLLI